MDDHVAQVLGDHGARIRNLEGWQTAQNGALLRLEERIASVERRIGQLGWGIAATLGGVIVDLALRIGGIR